MRAVRLAAWLVLASVVLELCAVVFDVDGEAWRAGVNRISMGPAAQFATLGTLQRVANEVRETGDWASLAGHGFGFGDAEALFSR